MKDLFIFPYYYKIFGFPWQWGLFDLITIDNTIIFVVDCLLVNMASQTQQLHLSVLVICDVKYERILIKKKLSNLQIFLFLFVLA